MTNNDSSEDRMRRLERTNAQLLEALSECREKLDRLEEVLKQTGQDNDDPDGGAV